MKHQPTQAQTSDDGAQKLRRIEQWHRDSIADQSFTVSAGMMNLMIAIVGRGHNPVKVFHWLKGVETITKHQVTGTFTLYCRDRITAEYVLHYLQEQLREHFHSKNIDTAFNGQKIRAMDAPQKKDPLSPAAMNALRQAGINTNEARR